MSGLPLEPRLRALFAAGEREQVVWVTHEAAKAADEVEPPDSLAPPLLEALAAQGISRLYSHQRRAFELLSGEGANVVIATGTASGKSLCFALPTLQAAASDPRVRALYLYPTKALAQDQARKLTALRLPQTVPAIYDGDTPQQQRRQIRQRATIVLSNPDMLHLGILPAHEHWAEFLHHLHYVVLDEAHVYRGVFGSHVAQVVRRLRRLCAAYGSSPRFVLASATIAEPQRFAERLVGLPFVAVTDDGAPHPERTVVLWNPPLEDPDLGTRRSALAEASFILSEAVLAGARAIGFAPTRKAAELIYTYTRQRLQERTRDWRGSGASPAERIQPYRAGYTPQQRRDIERRLFDHELDAVIATSALELGIDVGSLDVALVTGFPGTVTSLRQRWGRAGRAGHGWAVLVAGQDALDQFFMREPERLFSRPVEEAVIDLANSQILDAHLQSGAYELPLTAEDEQYFGEAGMLRAARLADAGRLRRTASGLVWAQPHSPAAQVNLRSASAEQFLIVESRTGAILGTSEQERVFRTAHPGAVYLHLGESYLVRRLDLDERIVHVEDHTAAYYTMPKVDKNVLVAGQALTRPLVPGAALFFGEIEVTEQVIGYQKRNLTDDRVIDTVALDLPEQVFTTEALWFTLEQASLQQILGMAPPEDARSDERLVAGSLHAAEHALIAILPLYAMCDRWDIGGLSTAWHWQTDQATIFIYDGYPGGIGLTRRACEAFESLAADARTLIAECPCESGCPSCVQSPKCGNLNEPLNKDGALQLLTALTAQAESGEDRQP
jgi:DEAD/DEAH box helicase domain-containing protein